MVRLKLNDYIDEDIQQPKELPTMASTGEGTDVRIDPPGCPADSDDRREKQEGYGSIVERLRSLVFCQEQNANTDEIRRLICTQLPDSACGVEDAIAPIRANLWSALLLGMRPEDLIRLEPLVGSCRGITHRHPL